MYPTMKGMDAVPSGSGVFYQAMPAVGADGKNIMKLIPVQIVNGQFVQSQISQPRTDPTPQKAAPINIAPRPVVLMKNASLNPSETQQVSHRNATPNQTSFQTGNSLNKRPLQIQTANLLAKAPAMAKPAANAEKLVRLPSQFPVTVKSPSLPSGQYLQIPPNAKVQTVSASEFPPAIKKQFFDSLSRSFPSSGNTASTSPISSMIQDTAKQSDAASYLLQVLSKMVNKTPRGPPSKASRPQLKLIPKFSQRPDSPIRWMIEEEDGSTAQTPDPLNSSSSVTSEIHHAAAQRETTSKRSDVLTKPVSQLSPGKSGQEQENTLVMCNGKVFLLAKKHPPPPQMGKRDSPTAATKSYEPNKTRTPSSQRSFQSGPPGTRRDVTITIPDEDEVIDLCDDDDSPQPAASVSASADTQPDEDNVIFVSYVPPQSESGPAEDCQQSTSTQQLERMEVEGEASSLNPAQDWTSPPSPNSCQMTDHALRQMFGITADVRICLPRIDEASDESVLSTTSPHTHIGPVKCSHFKPNTKALSALKCRSGQVSLNGTSCDVESEPATGYVEPLDDEDVLGTHENDPSTQDTDWRPQSKISVALNTSTRRIGRARKRTICPCCVPSTPAAKSSAKSVEPEKLAGTTEQTAQRGGRKKAVRKDVKTAAKNKQDCETAASDSLSTTSMDSDEAQPQDDIERLKELLRKKKTALEKMKNGKS